MTTAYILPTIGSSGVFKLAAPFDQKIGPSEAYTVKAIRTLSELESNSVDVRTTKYIEQGLSEQDYIDDLAVDMHFVTLQSGYGQFLEVPAKYILMYPRIDGVAYQRYNIVIGLPAIPMETSVELLRDELSDIAKDYIGAKVGSAIVETSTIVYVTHEEHALKEAQRRVDAAGIQPPVARIRGYQQINQSLRNHVTALEQTVIGLREQLDELLAEKEAAGGNTPPPPSTP